MAGVLQVTPFEQFFGGNIFVINLARRPDRLANFMQCMKALGIKFERFEAIDAGTHDGNTGCCASHRAVLDLVVQRGLERAFVFEDDSVIRPRFTDTFHQDVAAPLRELPPDWDLIYLGGGYGDDPQGWFSKHLIRINGMKTTSSYGVTAKSARELRDYIPSPCSDGIDNIFSGYAPSHRSFICEPRFFIQYENYSDLQRAKLNNGMSMEDEGHVRRLGKKQST
jgi:GR25 family glycosyltransferase involved in LPS biosynthesis